MNSFLKNVAATVVGLFVFSIIMSAFAFMSVIGMIASSGAAQPVEENSVLSITLGGSLQERSAEAPFGGLFGGALASTGIDDVVEAISKAKRNDNIKGIYLETGAFTADSYATLQALRRALEDFRSSGKWVLAYSDTYTQGGYYVASAADKVAINPYGQIDWHGIGAQPYYLKDLMGKFGVKMQVMKVGSYKSAPETFTADAMSPANREQTARMIGGIWGEMCKAVSKSRKVGVESLNNWADSLIVFNDTRDYIGMKLVDKTLYYDEVKAEVRGLLGLEEDEDIPQVSVQGMLAAADKDEAKGDEIAVYYACGDIVASKKQNVGADDCIVAEDVCKDLARLAEDEDVKAVVLRVNSGGGSAYASEQIWRSVKELRKEKPVVVSMGGMAASGAYYISCPANHIFAEATTLTGSIGIFGMFPDISGLLTEKLGVKFDEVKTNRNSLYGTAARPMTQEEMDKAGRYIDRGYALFRSRVAEGRKLTVSQAEAVAQGRVWLGCDAVGAKLVDGIGGLDKAVAKAAQLAKVEEYHTADYPDKAGWTEMIFGSDPAGNYLDARARGALGPLYEPLGLLNGIGSADAVQARMLFRITPR